MGARTGDRVKCGGEQLHQDERTATLSPKARPRVDEATTQKAYDAALNLIAQIGGYFADGKTINEIIFVPLAIMSRIIRTHDAIGLLLKNEHYQEAAVLALTQFELRFDLLYVASDIKRAAQWVEHENPKALTQSMKSKLKALFPSATADRLYETFGYLSGIKHGNPLYSELGFPGRESRGRFAFSTGPINDRFAKAFSKALFAYATYQLVWAAQVVNKLVAQYAVVEKKPRQDVQDLYMTLRPVEADFRRFLKNKVSARKTFFGIKALKSPRSR
jgi:hypothetical protein